MRTMLPLPVASRLLVLTLVVSGCATTSETPIVPIPALDATLPHTLAVARFSDAAPSPPGRFTITPGELQAMMIEELVRMKSFAKVVSLSLACDGIEQGAKSQACKMARELGADLVMAGVIEKMETHFVGHNIYELPAELILLTLVGIPVALGIPNSTYDGRIVVTVSFLDAKLEKTLVASPIQGYAIATTNSYQDGPINGEAESGRTGVLKDTMPRTLNQFFLNVRHSLVTDVDPLIGSNIRARVGEALPGAPYAQPRAETTTGYSWPSVSRFALVIGLSQYQHTADGGLTDLAFAAADARGFRDALIAQGWQADHIKCLTDGEATKAEVEKWLRYGPDLENGLFLVFWAGHGYPDQVDPRRLFLACYDTDLANPATGLRMGDVRSWLEERKVRNVLIVADACHAGGLVSGRSRDLSVRGLAGCMRPDSVPPGWVYLLGARAGDKAAEHPALKGGLFTHSFLEALGGAADGYGVAGRKDGTVTLGEIREYVRDKVKEKAFQLNLSGAFETQDHVNTGDNAIWNLTLKAK